MIQEFDFQAYILRSRSQTGVHIPRIQNYAYIEDIERSRQMAERELLQRALNLGIHAWKLTQGRRIQTQSHDIPRSDRIAPLWADVCFQFQHTPMPLKLAPSQHPPIEAYGGDEGSFFTLSPQAYRMPAAPLRFAFGQAIGALDNGHVPWLTLLRTADDVSRGFLSWTSQIPELLLHWRRSAQITQDRAGLLAARDMSAAILIIMKSELDWDDSEILREIRRYHEKRDVDWGEKFVENRVRALELFAESRIYRRSSGRPIAEIDESVRKIYSIF